METVLSIWNYIWPFWATIMVIVFVHELGHYLIARVNGIRIEVFSIGFGPEIVSRTDSYGTRWRLGLLPFGGYVKFFGDAGAAGGANRHLIAAMTEEERAGSFYFKRVGQRAAVVLGGPLGNFVFSIVVFAMLFATYGQRYTPPDISEVVAGSPAASAGLQPGDKILKIGGMAIERFEDMQAIVQQSPNQPLDLTIERAGATLSLSVTPALVDLDDGFGGTHKIGQLGISRANIAYRHVDPTRALGLAAKETFLMAYGTLEAIGQMIVGKRSTDDLGGPIRIGHMSGQVAQEGFVSLIYLMALLSINLGLINLFPVPMLDGGHLVFYLWEAVFRRPLRPRIQEIGLKVGFVLVIALMVWVTSKDLIRLDRMFDLF